MAEETKTENVIKDNEFTHRLFTKEKQLKHFQLFVSEFASLDHELDEIVNKLSDANEDDTIEILISSIGGYTYDLMKIENICREYFYNRTTTKLCSHGLSCGAFLFLIGDERIVFENSELMFHNVSMGIGGKFNEIEDQYVYNKKYWENYITRILCPYFTKTEISQLIKGKDFWLDALEMCKRGIATKICVFGQFMDADLYVKYRENPKDRADLIKGLYNARDGLSLRDAEYIEYEYKNLKVKK